MSTEAPPAPTTSFDATRVPPPPVDPTASSSAVPPERAFRPRRRMRFGIQSKLLIMLLATSILSALVAGFVGYTSGKNALQDSEFDRLTQARESRAREITSFFDQLTNSLVIYTRGSTAIEAVDGFTAGFQALKFCW